MNSRAKLRGQFHLEHWRNGECLDVYDFPNGITNEGLNHLLDVVFHGTTPVSPWYIGLINNSGYSAVADTDTMSSHAGWTELTSYDETVRQTWDEAAASSQSITSNTVATFTISATVAIKGIFITSSSTKSGTSGTLFSTALASSVINMVDDDELKVTYTVTAS